MRNAGRTVVEERSLFPRNESSAIKCRAVCQEASLACIYCLCARVLAWLVSLICCARRWFIPLNCRKDDGAPLEKMPSYVEEGSRPCARLGRGFKSAAVGCHCFSAYGPSRRSKLSICVSSSHYSMHAPRVMRLVCCLWLFASKCAWIGMYGLHKLRPLARSMRVDSLQRDRTLLHTSPSRLVGGVGGRGVAWAVTTWRPALLGAVPGQGR